MKIYQIGILFLVLLVTSCSINLPEDVEMAYNELPETIDFNFHIKPILSDRCYACHGPDENTRKAGLRLDVEEVAFMKLESGNRAFVPGSPSGSESIRRILSDDPEVQMPPSDSHLSLNAWEKAIIIKWIEQDAEWKNHWAFIQPNKSEVPQFENTKWPVRNPIDNFVFQTLVRKGFKPSPEADKERLLRRVTIDLTGLPPTIEEIDDFLKDESESAYEKVVDRLLETDAYAERLALDWMDLSRYADSHGLHADGWRSMWPWRDWVIEAFKKNMPYDQFVIWQLAGDLMPNATKEQKLATAFNRNHPMTAEGGAIDEEFRLNYVWDRSETVGTAFMGLTVACARCHDHKFDPISQKDYFQMAAFFNNVREIGMTGDDGNYGPMLPLPNPSEEKEIKRLERAIEEKEQHLQITKKELADLNSFIERMPRNLGNENLIGHFPFDNANTKSDEKGNFVLDRNSKSTSRALPKLTEGKVGKAVTFTGEYDEVYLQGIPNFELTDEFSATLWLRTTKREAKKTQTLLGTTGDKNSYWSGWDFYLDSLNRMNVRFVHSLPHNLIHVRSKDSVKTNEWNHAAFSYDASGNGEGIRLFLNGTEIEKSIVYDKLYKSMKAMRYAVVNVPDDRSVKVARSYRGHTGEFGVFKGEIDEIRIYGKALLPLEIAKIAVVGQSPEPNPELLSEYTLENAEAVKQIKKELRSIRTLWLEKMMSLPEIMVMEDMPKKRKALAYNRGDYEQPMYEVEMNTPEVLPEFPKDYPKNRLGLAKWLFSKENPLTARVTVNRYWQIIFGKGLVETPQDFGVQGALPTHPKLIDWLAVDFMENGWNVKSLLKTMVLSHTYRQTSKTSQELSEKDPNNIYLARSNSYRLPAEMIRDNALAASGLLVKQIGGMSVRPYQPPNLWIEKNSFSKMLYNYKETKGDSLYRRGLYTFIRRTSPHPAMTAFDAPSREVCTVKRENTNTPLQALVLMNDTQFVEASKILAQRIQTESADSVEAQITRGFRLAVSRYPKKEELSVLKELYETQLDKFKKNPRETKALLSVGEKPLQPSLINNKTAALTMVANTILNHDEAYMKR